MAAAKKEPGPSLTSSPDLFFILALGQARINQRFKVQGSGFKVAHSYCYELLMAASGAYTSLIPRLSSLHSQALSFILQAMKAGDMSLRVTLVV